MFPKADGSRERKLAVERQGEAKGAAPPEHNFSPPERKEAGDGLQGGLVPAAANEPDSERGRRTRPPSVSSKGKLMKIPTYQSNVGIENGSGGGGRRAPRGSCA